MRWIVIGSKGMLGTDLVDFLLAQGHEVQGFDRPEIDITSLDSVRGRLLQAEVVVNCAAYTQVDEAQANEALAFRINATGPQYLAQRCQEIGARLIQFSTDYVFDGTGSEPYGEDSPLNPVSAYGRTKASGEWAVMANTDDYLIVRTAWLYGKHGNCFPKTMATLAATKPTFQVVADQLGQPTWTRDLVELVYRLVQAKVASGIYHGTAQGQASWHDFAQAIVESVGKDRALVAACTTADFPRPAPRPAFSVLGHEKFAAVGVVPIGQWLERWQAASKIVIPTEG